MFARDEFASPAPAQRDDIITGRPLPWVYAANWLAFDRRNLNEEISVSPGGFAVFGSGDRHQVALWVVRREPLAHDGTVCRVEAPGRVTLQVPGLLAGTYGITTFNTEAGIVEARFQAVNAEGPLRFEVPVVPDLAVAIRPAVQADTIPRVNR